VPELRRLVPAYGIIDGDICSLPNRDGGIESQEGHWPVAVTVLQ
jgi:hypothetical protein